MNVLITGVSNYLGQAIVHRLIRDNPFRRVFGVDRKPPRVLGPVRYVPADVQSDAFAELLVVNDIQAVLHLSYALGTHSARDEVAVARRMVEVAGIAGVERLVFVSRDQVYEAGTGPCSESAALRSPRSLPPEVQGKAQVEAELAARGSACPVVTVRIGNLLGRDRGAPLDRLLSLPFVVKPMGRDPLIQFLQADDAAEVFVRAATAPNLRGAYNAAGANPIPLSTVAGILEKRMFSLPPWLMRPMGGFLTRTGQVSDGQQALRELLQGVPLTCDRLDELGYTPRYTTRQALALWRANTLRALA